MGVSGVCLCGPVLACFAWGEGKGGGGERGRGREAISVYCTVNVLRRRVAGLAYFGTVSETARQENLCGF
jgi:hypothetical protein